uniref:Uncharacterized protein n=1 Tax=Spermophilus dauricus TaxID=99837 RepID=A0A8C9UP53_SPEDA
VCSLSLSKISLYPVGFVASPCQVERKLPLTELYCNCFSFMNIIFTGLIVHRACNKIITLCCETTLRISTEGHFKGTGKWNVSMTLVLVS